MKTKLERLAIKRIIELAHDAETLLCVKQAEIGNLGTLAERGSPAHNLYAMLGTIKELAEAVNDGN